MVLILSSFLSQLLSIHCGFLFFNLLLISIFFFLFDSVFEPNLITFLAFAGWLNLIVSVWFWARLLVMDGLLFAAIEIPVDQNQSVETVRRWIIRITVLFFDFWLKLLLIWRRKLEINFLVLDLSWFALNLKFQWLSVKVLHGCFCKPAIMFIIDMGIWIWAVNVFFSRFYWWVAFIWYSQ